MALIGAAAGAGLVGGTLLGRKKAGQQQQPTLAPGPTDAQPSAITPPAPPVIDPGANQAAANLAGKKVRKRAAAGSLLTNPKAPVSSAMPVGARSQPRSLIGY